MHLHDATADTGIQRAALRGGGLPRIEMFGRTHTSACFRFAARLQRGGSLMVPKRPIDKGLRECGRGSARSHEESKAKLLVEGWLLRLGARTLHVLLPLAENELV